LGGDFNAILNPVWISHLDKTANPSSKLLNQFMTELNIINL